MINLPMIGRSLKYLIKLSSLVKVIVLSIFKKKEDSDKEPISSVSSSYIVIPELNWINALKFDYIVLHHSLSPDGVLRDWDGIRKYHMSYRVDYVIVTREEYFNRKVRGQGKRFDPPFKEIGYYLGLERVGGQLQVQVGRPLSMTGAHAIGFNGTNLDKYCGLSVCMVGDFDKNSVDMSEWEAVKELLMYLLSKTGLGKDKIIGHRETYPMLGKPVEKSCPGSLFDMSLLRHSL